MARYDYRIASGHNVALGSLTNVENIGQLWLAGVRPPPVTVPVNTYPTRYIALSGIEYGDGLIKHEWRFSIIPSTGLDYLQDTYLGAVTVVSAAVTIYTRLQDQGVNVYARYNAYLARPIPGQDYQYRQRKIINLALRFNGLVAI
jgi:hypothetical protein